MGFVGNLICLVVDHWHVGYLGAYGNTWIRTPAFDRFAAQSFLFDRAVIDSPELAAFYRSCWHGVHAAAHGRPTLEDISLAALFSEAGWRTVLVTDEPQLAEQAGGKSFSESVIVRQEAAANGGLTVAADLGETDAAGFFAAAGSVVERMDEPALLWLHTGTLGRIWDAPIEYRRQYRDEEDPEIGQWASVPSEVLTEAVDPDELLNYSHAYAGQVSLVDQLFGSLIEVVEQSPIGRNAAVMLMSPRGIALGEHGQAGLAQALYGEFTHVPWMMRLPSDLGKGERSGALVQPAELFATLLECGSLPVPGKMPATVGTGKSVLPLVRGEPAPGFDRSLVVSPSGERRIETPAWAMRVSRQGPTANSASATERLELFVKPDDWFEVNEISDRCSNIVTLLQHELDQFEKRAAQGAAALPEVPAELVERDQ